MASEPVDFIIDGLLGPVQTLMDLDETLKSHVCQLIVWANDNRAPILSLEVSSGLHGLTGMVYTEAFDGAQAFLFLHLSITFNLSIFCPLDFPRLAWRVSGLESCF